jgi:hypothetical protein
MPTNPPPETPPQIEQSVKEIIAESSDSFLMLPEAIDRIRREHPDLKISRRELSEILMEAAAKAGIPIGLEWSD